MLIGTLRNSAAFALKHCAPSGIKWDTSEARLAEIMEHVRDIPPPTHTHTQAVRLVFAREEVVCARIVSFQKGTKPPPSVLCTQRITSILLLPHYCHAVNRTAAPYHRHNLTLVFYNLMTSTVFTQHPVPFCFSRSAAMARAETPSA